MDTSKSLDQRAPAAGTTNDGVLTPAVPTHKPSPPRASTQVPKRKPVPPRPAAPALTKPQQTPVTPPPPPPPPPLAESPDVRKLADGIASIALEPQDEVYAHRSVETLTGVNWPGSLTSLHQTSYLAARIAGATRAKDVDEFLAEQKSAWGVRPEDFEINAIFERATRSAHPAGDKLRLEGLYCAATVARDFLYQAIEGLRDVGYLQEAVDSCLNGLGRLVVFLESRSEQVTPHDLMHWLYNIPGFAGALHIALQANISNPAAVRVTLSLTHKQMVKVAAAEILRLTNIPGTSLRQINDYAAFILSATCNGLLQPRVVPASWPTSRKLAADAILKANPTLYTPAAADISRSEDRRSIANLVGLLDDDKTEEAGPYVARLIEIYGHALTDDEKQYCAAYYSNHGRPQDTIALAANNLMLPRLFAMMELDQVLEVAKLCTTQVIARYPILASFRFRDEQVDSRMLVLYGRVAMLALPDDEGAEPGAAEAARGWVGQVVQRVEPSVQQACLDQLQRESWARPTTPEEEALRYLLAYIECGGDEISATHLGKIPPLAGAVSGKAKANNVESVRPQISTAHPLSAERKAWFRENLEKPFVQHTTAWYGDATADHLNATTQFYKGMANRQTRALRAEAEVKLAEETGLVSILARSDFKNPRWPAHSNHMSRLGLTKQRYEETTHHIESLRLGAKGKGLFGGASDDAIPAVTAFVNAENKRLANEDIGVFWRFLNYMTTAYVYELVLVDVEAYRAQRRAIDA